MATEKRLPAPEKSVSDEATGSDDDEARNLVLEMFSKGLFEILASGDPRNLSGDKRVEQEERLHKMMREFGGKAEEFFSKQSPEWKENTASMIRSMVPPHYKARAEAFLRDFKIVETDEAQSPDAPKS